MVPDEVGLFADEWNPMLPDCLVCTTTNELKTAIERMMHRKK